MRQLINAAREKLFVQSVFFRHPVLKHAYSIASHLTSEERFELYKLAQGKKTILEIGSYVGASAACFGAAQLKLDEGKIFCVDTWQNDAMTEGKKDTYQAFLENTKPYVERIVPVRGFSTQVVERIKKETTTLDLLFIDGDHAYEGVKADWDAYKDFLTEGSVVIFHDYGWAEGVQRVIEKDALPAIKEHDSLPNMWWGSIGR
jgi:predicted O-methyltransferase YrrM